MAKAKLTALMRREIKDKHAAGRKRASLASEYRVSETTIGKIVTEGRIPRRRYVRVAPSRVVATPVRENVLSVGISVNVPDLTLLADWPEANVKAFMHGIALIVSAKSVVVNS